MRMQWIPGLLSPPPLEGLGNEATVAHAVPVMNCSYLRVQFLSRAALTGQESYSKRLIIDIQIQTPDSMQTTTKMVTA